MFFKGSVVIIRSVFELKISFLRLLKIFTSDELN